MVLSDWTLYDRACKIETVRRTTLDGQVNGGEDETKESNREILTLVLRERVKGDSENRIPVRKRVCLLLNCSSRV